MADMKTASDIIDELGGTAETARITGRGMPAVSTWRSTGRIPATFLEIIRARVPDAPSEVFGIVPARETAA